ncbi:Oidioi.mRNA.OKI2018_I69.chr2.g5890.t1.cds [Oikopleura dioica]|uniref:ditrans,polycis-polyprenyl diphosphate synthase [(2E,6E)-farnesyldiphosphate specific] n=1 Tax=Oikopleura dioica TaxID=34765 RepID=A0ABN7T7D7_OIKDI|nr:Oidioi.mRNA.OKI2018_I69.chr2.g5890.t1.cds [Oikopleura dioica]
MANRRSRYFGIVQVLLWYFIHFAVSSISWFFKIVRRLNPFKTKLSNKFHHAPEHIALVAYKNSLIDSSQMKSVALELLQRGCKKISIWDPDRRMEKSKIDWSELHCRLLTPKNGGSTVSESIKRMKASSVSVKEVNLELLDHFIGPNGEEPHLLLSCGATDLVSTQGYPPWALRLTTIYPLPSPYSKSQINEVLARYSTVTQRFGK